MKSRTIRLMCALVLATTGAVAAQQQADQYRAEQADRDQAEPRVRSPDFRRRLVDGGGGIMRPRGHSRGRLVSVGVCVIRNGAVILGYL